MIVYNVTIKVTPAIKGDWVQWMQQEHIPEVMATGLFNDWKFFRLLEQDETEGFTYIVQYFTATMQNYQHYIENNAATLRKKTFDKWGNQFIAFRTVMKIVN